MASKPNPSAATGSAATPASVPGVVPKDGTDTGAASQAIRISLTPSQLLTAVRYVGNIHRAMFLWGHPGISKSAVLKQAATERGYAFVDVRLTQMNPVDLRGMPFPVEEYGTKGVRWSPPMLLPRDLDLDGVADLVAAPKIIRFWNPKGKNDIHYVTEPEIVVTSVNPELTARIITQDPDRFVVVLEDADKKPQAGQIVYSVRGKAKAIVALEEFNSAPTSVVTASYSLIHDRFVGEYVAPEDVIFVATGNYDTDGGLTFKMPTPVKNRFIHIDVEVNYADWEAWAIGERINPLVMGFLAKFKKAKLFKFNPKAASNAFPTPRTWHMVSDLMNANPDMDKDIGRALVCGCIGQEIGIEFWEFRKLADALPDVDDVLSGRFTKLAGSEKSNISLCVTLAAMLLYELRERIEQLRARNIKVTKIDPSPELIEWMKGADIFFKFMTENFNKNVSIMAAKAGVRKHKLPFHSKYMPYFKEFADKNTDLIMRV